MAVYTSISMFLMAGETYTIEIPVEPSNNYGYFPRKGSLSSAFTGKDGLVELKNGFYVENEEIGEITQVYKDKVAVDYLHKYSNENTVWFFASTGERARIFIGTMPVHDHASVSTGGPAYASYYTDLNDGTGGDS